MKELPEEQPDLTDLKKQLIFLVLIELCLSSVLFFRFFPDLIPKSLAPEYVGNIGRFGPGLLGLTIWSILGIFGAIVRVIREINQVNRRT